MKKYQNNKKIFIFIICWRLLETGLTLIQLYKMISESPVGEFIKRILSPWI